jgi:hypothetical protein
MRLAKHRSDSVSVFLLSMLANDNEYCGWCADWDFQKMGESLG